MSYEMAIIVSTGIAVAGILVGVVILLYFLNRMLARRVPVVRNDEGMVDTREDDQIAAPRRKENHSDNSWVLDTIHGYGRQGVSNGQPSGVKRTR